MSNLVKRISKLEGKVNPANNLLVVIVNKNESAEDAKTRTMKEQGIEKLADNCYVLILNYHGSSN